MNNNKQGIIFSATGETCRNEVVTALKSLTDSNPHLPICIFTDKVSHFSDTASETIQVREIPSPQFSFIDKIYGFIHTPFDKNIFLDSDTFIVEDISDLFHLLDRFEFAGCHSKGDQAVYSKPPETSLPLSFPDYNSGVIAFKRNRETRTTFETWLKKYKDNPHHKHDQPSLREAVFTSKLSLYVLPREYNFLPGLAGLINGKVKVFHSPKASKNTDNFMKFTTMINGFTGLRMFVPPNKMWKIT